MLLLLLACADPQKDASEGPSDPTDDSGTPPEDGPSRAFALGFTPFPYDTTAASARWVVDTLPGVSDLWVDHTLGGVPWVEALGSDDLADYGDSVRDNFGGFVDTTPDGARTYVAVSPLDDSRADLADWWGDAEHQARTGDWADADFDDPDVMTAYLNYTEAVVAATDPDILAIGVEVNLLEINSPTRWRAYLRLHEATYTALKARHPDLTVAVTVTAPDLLEGWTDADHADQLDVLADLLPLTDLLGLSFYPFMSAYLANPLPDDTFDQLAALAGDTPLFIAETGYPAQTTELPSYGLTFEGTPEKQDAWVAWILAEAEAREMPAVAWFLLRDYDALWEALGSQDYMAVWRDTGLYDEDGGERPGLGTWRGWLDLPRREPDGR